MEHRFYKTIRTPNNFYVYDAANDTIIEIGEQAYNYLNNPTVKNRNEEIEQLIHNNYLKGSNVEKVIHPETEYIESYLDTGVGSIILQVTQMCNLSCSYCPYANTTNGQFQRNHSEKIMSVDMAFKAVDFLLEHSSDIDGNNIGFYGGEPLIAFNVIKETIEYAKERFIGKNLTFSFTTNGTLLDEEKLRYLFENEVSIMFSIDGPEDVHNRNRKFQNGKGSYEKTIDNFKKAVKIYGEKKHLISVNMVFDPRFPFTDIADYVKGDLFKEINVEGELADDTMLENKYVADEKFIVEYEYEIFKGYLEILGYFKQKTAIPIIINSLEKEKQEFLHFFKEYVGLPKTTAPSGACVPGKRKLFINVNGDFFPCEKVDELSDSMIIGNLNDGFYIDNVKKLLNFHQETANMCKNCWAFRHCTVCVASLTDSAGNISVEMKKQACLKSKAGVEHKLRVYLMYKELGRL